MQTQFEKLVARFYKLVANLQVKISISFYQQKQMKQMMVMIQHQMMKVHDIKKKFFF